jgi:hypothetical protein
MTYDDKINAFKKHLGQLRQSGTEFDIWLSTAIEHVHEIFTITSPQHSSITHLKSDYDLAKIYDKSATLIVTYQNKATQLLESFIDQLEEIKRRAIAEAAQKRESEIKKEFKLKQQLDDLTPKYDFLFAENQRLQNELNSLRNKQKTKSGFWKTINGVYHINVSLFWTLALASLGGFFAFGQHVGTTKFDKNLIDLSDSNRTFKSDIVSLKDTVKVRENVIEYMRHVSDSTLNILGNMPYKQMTLDSLSFKKVQSTIEKAGAALYLNKDYHY